MQNKKELMYRVGENKVEFSQTSKGFWYCSAVTINCYSAIDGVVVMERAIEDIEKLLSKINQRADHEQQEGCDSTEEKGKIRKEKNM